MKSNVNHLIAVHFQRTKKPFWLNLPEMNIVIRDRQKMAEDGMFVIITTLDSKTAKIRNKIDIISRGFVYMNESKDLMLETRRKVKEIVERSAGKEYTTNWSYIKDRLRDEIGELLYHKTHRRPLILPVVLEV